MTNDRNFIEKNYLNYKSSEHLKEKLKKTSKKPTEDDLDDLEVSIFALVRMEGLVDTQKEVDILIETQRLINKYLRQWKEDFPEFF